MRQALWPDMSLDTIIHRARILVIDDQDFPYKTLFKKDGFNVDKWNDVTRLQDLEQGKYDLILLDLQGIGGRLSTNDQGLGVLRHLKESNPDQVIVAYSNADWGVRYQPFFDLADAVLPKSADYLDFKRVVEECLQDHFDVDRYVSRFQAALTEAGFSKRKSARIARALVSTEDIEPVKSAVRTKVTDTSRFEHLISLANLVVKVAELWKK